MAYKMTYDMRHPREGKQPKGEYWYFETHFTVINFAHMILLIKLGVLSYVDSKYYVLHM